MDPRVNLPSVASVRGRTRTRRTGVRERKSEWKRADDLLDEALKETFPARDAVSITRNPAGD
jgi:hypothetical protein